MSLSEAGEAWLVERIKEKSPEIPEYGDMVGAMKFGIRMFSDEVQKRAEVHAQWRYDQEYAIAIAFDELRLELLGG